MRRALAVSAALLLAVLVAVQPAAGYTYLMDGFEDGDLVAEDGTAWDNPDGLMAAAQDRAATGSWSGRLSSDGSEARSSLDIGSPLHGDTTLTFEAQVNSTSSNTVLRLADSGASTSYSTAVNFGVINGDWSYHDGSSWVSLEPASADTWTTLTFQVNQSADTFNVTIDGTTYTDKPLYSNVPAEHLVAFYGSGSTSTDEVWLDDVEVSPAKPDSVDGDDPIDWHENATHDGVTLLPSDMPSGYDWAADPFLFREGDTYHLIAEAETGSYVDILQWTSKTPHDKSSWTYQGVMIDHAEVSTDRTSFPDTFRYNGSYYMMPDRSANNGITLYKNDDISDTSGWVNVSQPVTEAPWGATLDHNLWQEPDGRWYLLLGTDEGSDTGRGGQRLFYSDDLEADGWTQHPDNPVVSGRDVAGRAGGTTIPRPNKDYVLVTFQDGSDDYGERVRAYALTNYTADDTYDDTELVPWSPVVEASKHNDATTTWNETRMHTYSATRKPNGEWLVAVDGMDSDRSHWSVNLYDSSRSNTYRVSGTVVNESGDPQPGARVELRNRMRWNTTVVTDSNGQYEYYLGNRSYRIQAAGDGISTEEERFYVDGGSVTGNDITVTGSTTGTTTTDLAVGSEHTTTSDFLDAQQLINVSADGDQVVLDPGGEITSGGTARYRFEQDVTDDWNANDGTDNTGTGYVTGIAPDGSYAKDLPGSGHVETGVDAGGDFTYSTWVDVDDASLSDFQMVAGRWGGDMASAEAMAVQSGNIDFRVYDGTNVHSVTSSVTSGQHHFVMTYDASTDTLTAYIDGSQVAQNTNAPMRDVSETMTIGAASDDTLGFTGSADDFRIYDRELDSSEVEAIYEGEPYPVPATYRSDWHNVSDAAQARVDIATADNVTVDVTVNDRDGNELGTGSYTSTGEKQIDLSGQTNDDIEMVVDVTSSSGEPAFALNSDSIWFKTSSPELSNLSPADGTVTPYEDVDLSGDVADADFPNDNVTVDWYIDGTKVNSTTVDSNRTATYTTNGLSEGSHTWYMVATDEYGRSVDSQVRSLEVEHYPPSYDGSTLSPSGELESSEESFTVDISDGDFPYSGDNVSAELVIDNSSVGTDYLTSNGTANVTTTIGFGGSVYYHWNITDSYGHSLNTSDVEIKTPGSIEIRDAQEPHGLLNNSSGEIQFYIDNDDEPDEIYTRNASDGVVEMGGLPKNESFVVVADAENHTTRRVFVEDLFQTSTVYLPHDNATTVQPVFKLNDYTGDFPGENTVLEIQRNVQDEWRTVEGDYFSSVNQFTATLLFNERHRLEITNTATGRSRDLGQFTPTESGTVVLTVSGDSTTVEPQYEPAVNFEPDIDSLPASPNVTVNTTVDQRDVSLDGFNVTLSSGGEQIAYREVTGDGRTHMVVDLNSTSGQTVNATVRWRAADGSAGTVNRTWQLSKRWPGSVSLIGGIMDLGIGEDVGALLTLLLMGLVVGFTATRLSPLASGGSAVAVAGAGMLIGWLPMPVFVIAAAGYGVLALSEVQT